MLSLKGTFTTRIPYAPSITDPNSLHIKKKTHMKIELDNPSSYPFSYYCPFCKIGEIKVVISDSVLSLVNFRM